MRILYLIAKVTVAWLVVGCSFMPATIDPGDKIDKDKGVLLSKGAFSGAESVSKE